MAASARPRWASDRGRVHLCGPLSRWGRHLEVYHEVGAARLGELAAPLRRA